MKKDSEEFSEEETARRRDAVLKIMVNTPPQPRTNPPTRSKKRKTTVAGPAKAKPSARRGKP